MSLHEYLRDDPDCQDLLAGAVWAVEPLLEDPDPAPIAAVLDTWAFDLAGRMPLPWNLHTAIDVLNAYLFQEIGLAGDQETYDDPANAALPLVLSRRRGLPIALSILWLVLARRLGFPAVGIALPGHFVTGLNLDLGTLYFDPFSGGQALGEEQMAELVRRATGGQAVFSQAMLAPVSNRAILVRLVRNLHVRFVRLRAWQEALWTATHLVLLNPDDSLSYRDRAFVHFHRGETVEGLQDMQAAAELDPDSAGERQES